MAYKIHVYKNEAYSVIIWAPFIEIMTTMHKVVKINWKSLSIILSTVFACLI